VTTKLDGGLRRELLIGQEPYALTLSEEGLNLVFKGRREALEIRWAEQVVGDAALATAHRCAKLAPIYGVLSTMGVLRALAIELTTGELALDGHATNGFGARETGRRAIGRRLLDLDAFPRTTVRTLASRLGPHQRVGNSTRIAP
jgi:hypothetical protein